MPTKEDLRDAIEAISHYPGDLLTQVQSPSFRVESNHLDSLPAALIRFTFRYTKPDAFGVGVDFDVGRFYKHFLRRIESAAGMVLSAQGGIQPAIGPLSKNRRLSILFSIFEIIELTEAMRARYGTGLRIPTSDSDVWNDVLVDLLTLADVTDGLTEHFAYFLSDTSFIKQKAKLLMLAEATQENALLLPVIGPEILKHYAPYMHSDFCRLSGKHSKELALISVKANAWNIGKFEDDVDIQLAAVRRDKNVVLFLAHPSEEAKKLAVQKDPMMIFRVGDVSFTNDELVELADKDARILKTVSYENGKKIVNKSSVYEVLQNNVRVPGR